MGSSERSSILDAALGRLPALAARCFALDYSRLALWQRVLFQVSLIACLLNAGGSVFDFFHYGGTDLRIRVVGARALLRGLDPYTLTDSPDLPPELRDPHQLDVGLSRCTYPPSLLLLYAPLSPLPYPVQRALWMLLEWAALAAMLALLTRLLRSQRARYVFSILTLTLIAASFFWRLHVERGQYYVFIGLLLAAGSFLCLRRRSDHVGAGLLFGVAAALRPTTVLLVLPLGVTGRWKTVLSAGLAALAVVALTLPLAGLDGWRRFTRLAGEWERAVNEPGYLAKNYPRRAEAPEPVDGFQPAVLPTFGVNLSITPGFTFLTRTVPGLPAALTEPVLCRLTLLAVAAIVLVVFWAAQPRPAPIRPALLVGFLLTLLSDYFVPVRISYVDVLFCLPIALALPVLIRPSYRPFFLILVGAFLLSVVPIGSLWSEGYWTFANVARSVTVLYVCARPLFVRPERGSRAGVSDGPASGVAGAGGAGCDRKSAVLAE